MLRIGLTGGISSGKSTVSNMLKARGIPIIDADHIARDVVEPGEPALKKIISVFGSTIIKENGILNRKKLGNIIFSDESLRYKLNSIMHPAIRAKMLSLAAYYEEQREKVIVLDIPLLIESELMGMVDKILLVYVDPDTQLERLMKRDQLSIDTAKLRINSQMPLEDKKQYADEIINNSLNLESTETQLEVILSKWGILQ